MIQLGVEHSLNMPELVPRQESPSMDGVCTSSSVVMPVLFYLEILLGPCILKRVPFKVLLLCLSPISDSYILNEAIK